MGTEVIKIGRILIFLVHVVLVLVVAPVLLVIDLNDYKSEIEAKVKQMMSRDLTIEDDIKQAQPVTFADRNSPPVLLIHGKEDKTVYEKNSLVMSMALKKNGNRVIQKSIEGLGHLGILLAIAKPKLFGVDIIKEIKGSISEFNAS